MEKKLYEYTLKDYIKKASDTSSMPGGGSICALNGSLAASLGMMCLKLSKENIEQEKLQEAIEVLEEVQEQLMDSIEEDGKSFDDVLKAFKMPKNTPEEEAFRKQKIQEGYIHAIEVPKKTVVLSAKILEILQKFDKKWSSHGITDVKIAKSLGKSAIVGSLETIDLNLESLKDEEIRKNYEKELERYRQLEEEN